MLPSLFFAHGAPTLAIEKNSYTDTLQKLAALFPKPKAIVLFSAHWENKIQSIGAAEEYSTIYDFGGFPDELYQIQYPAKGDRQLAERISGLFAQHQIPARIDDQRGLDHGAWVILRLLYPDASIPVVALSVNPFLANAGQYQIGKALASLREDDILIVGSGGTVHNLWKLRWNQGPSVQPEEWAVSFDNWLDTQLTAWNTQDLFDYETKAPHASDAVPRNEHFIPLLLAMGASDNDRKAKRLFQSYQLGSLSLSCWQFGE